MLKQRLRPYRSPYRVYRFLFIILNIQCSMINVQVQLIDRGQLKYRYELSKFFGGSQNSRIKIQYSNQSNVTGSLGIKH
jgi:hypothetical protein